MTEILADSFIPRFVLKSLVFSEQRLRWMTVMWLRSQSWVPIRDSTKFIRRVTECNDSYGNQFRASDDGTSDEHVVDDLTTVGSANDTIKERFRRKPFVMIRYGLLVLAVWIAGTFKLLIEMLAVIV